MDFIGFMTDYFKDVLSHIPYQVIVAVFAVIIITELTKQLLGLLEKVMEKKKGKEIRFFDHTKIILSVFWSFILNLSFCAGKIYSVAEFPLYMLVTVGGASVLYELVWKKLRG